ncbi:MAG TPA: prepilin-type N-terminal cleavage/methylation domain-containing protein [Alphaproteobacteria bacterium]|nr:prepilin-type N-terminal cleavage/methylation domain-containing protein [Alphaproteobacteria bacterium]
MTQSTLQSRQSEQGFTLVELAIVMIIIGLLIGGILKGQELIENSRVSATVAQAKAIESGISGFRDKYAGLPGDIATPNTRLPNCAAAICSNAGNGDGFIQTATANNPGAAGGESDNAFVQLGVSGFIGGIDPAVAAVGAGSHPQMPITGGFWNIGYSNGVVAATGQIAQLTLAGHYIVSTAGSGAVGASTVLKPVQAANIDRKIDNGNAVSGTVVALGTAGGANTNCANAGAYNEQFDTAVCGVYIKVQ